MNNWESKKLGDILTLEYGSGLKQDTRTGSGFPVVGSSGIIGNHSKFIVNAPGIVIGRKGTVGGLTFMNSDFWPIDTAYYVKPKIYVDWKWLFYRLNMVNFKKLSLSDVVPGLKRELVYNIKINFPSLPEQKAIAEILSTIDDAIQKSDEVISRTERLKREIMNKLLTQGIGHKNFKETKIGKIPNDWKMMKIKDLGEVVTGKTPSTLNKKYWIGKIPFITPGDIDKSKYVKRTERNISKEAADVTSKILPANTILVVCIGSTIGKIGLTINDSISNQQINSVIIDSSKFNANFIYYLFSKISKKIKSFSGTAAVPIINKTLFERIQISVPQLNEQNEIANILSDLDSKIEFENLRKHKFTNIKKGIMNDLFSGKKRVK